MALELSPSPPSRLAGPAVPEEPIWRLTVQQYHRMIQAGILTDEHRVELLEGWLVARMVKNPPHETAVSLIRDWLARAAPAGWYVDKERPVTLDAEDSEPEPDVMIMRGDIRKYASRHPGPGDVALIVEVADSSLDRDRGSKKRLYASASIPIYWITNLLDGTIEVYSQPSGICDRPDFHCRQDFSREGMVPLVLEGQLITHVPVRDLMP